MEDSDKLTGEVWKALGNRHFEAMRYVQALEAYNKGLKEDSGEINLLSNRGATYLKLEMYEDSLKDCESVLLLVPTHFKAIYRKTRALCSLEKFHEAKEFAAKQIQNGQDEVNRNLLSEALEKIEILIKQKDHGIYDMPTFMKNPKTHFADVATFVGPVIISKARVCQGRGLFAIEDIKAGQLIIVEKAFAVQYKETANIDKLVTDIEKRLKCHPALIQEVYKLYAGCGDLGKVEEDDKEFGPTELDLDRIKAICKFNCFGGKVRPQTTATIKPSETLGLWMLPSFSNHDCVDCNCSWKIFGNVMFIRASKMIKCGEEILISYCDSIASYSDRLEIFNNFGFTCQCRLCTLEQNELVSVAEERKKLLEQLENLLSSPDIPLKESGAPEDIIEKIENLRSDKSMNQFLSSSFAILGMEYQENGNTQQSVAILQKAYNSVKNLPMADTHLLFCVAIAVAYLEDGIFDLAKQWIQILKKELKIAYGSDSSDIMEYLDPELVPGLKLEGIEV